MDDVDTVADLQTLIIKFCRERDWDQFHNLKDLAIGITTEGGELLERFRFRTEAECAAMLDDPKASEAIRDELADTVYFLLRFAQMARIDLSEALKDKLAKNAEKYPADLVRGKNKKYDEY